MRIRLPYRLPRLLAALGLGALAAGCAPAQIDDQDGASSGGAITDVEHTGVKRQSIGNCWLYATATWAESMELAATGSDLDASESYWTYWHWYEQILNRGPGEIQTGGSYSTARGIIQRRGLVTEKDFISGERDDEMSQRQHDALDRINDALKDGDLETAEARRDPARVREALDDAWRLSRAVKRNMTKVFGERFERSLLSKDEAGAETASTADTPIKRARDVVVRFSTGPGTTATDSTLEDALDKWREVTYPEWTPDTVRAFEQRFQRALHDRQPVIISWFVDFAALDTQGRFFAPPATPGRQGGHMTVIEDYQINDVPGFGTLKAGVLETRPEALAAALADEAKIEFVRVKNSWGSIREDRQFSLPGYHDLYMAYLKGPVQQCTEKDGTADPSNCWDTTPLNDMVIPPGY